MRFKRVGFVFIKNFLKIAIPVRIISMEAIICGSLMPNIIKVSSPLTKFSKNIISPYKNVALNPISPDFCIFCIFSVWLKIIDAVAIIAEYRNA